MVFRLEQERRDHEMAVRLAKETNGHVEGSPPQLRRYFDNSVHNTQFIFNISKSLLTLCPRTFCANIRQEKLISSVLD